MLKSLKRRIPFRKLASLVFNSYSPILNDLNSNALMLEFFKKNEIGEFFDTRFDLYDYINPKGSIDYFEFGVYKGESIKYWLNINESKESRFWGFDSFEGLPENWEGFSKGHHDKGTFNLNGNAPNIEDKRLKFCIGWFQKSLGPFLANYKKKNKIVIHLDADLYNSTLYVLTKADHIIAPDDIIVFDEFFSSSHEFKAFYDYSNSYLREFKILGVTGKKPYIQVALQCVK